MKNRTFFKGLCLLYSSCLTLPGFASSTIYDLNKAASIGVFNKSQDLIQAASFRNKSYALKYQQRIKLFTSFPVNIIHKNGYFRVIVGPIKPASEMRIAARKILNGLNKSKANYPIKTNQHINAPIPQKEPIIVPPINSKTGYLDKDGFVAHIELPRILKK